jgi:hypothetical protein
MTNNQIEKEIQAKGLTAPRITPADIEANIASEHYFTAKEGQQGSVQCFTGAVPPPLELLTFCVLVLRNGFTVTGESACASPENFDAEVGRKIARASAVDKMWPLIGYELRSKLHEQATTNMSFGKAIDALKLGKRVSRAGWNGKGMWLSLSCDGEREVAAENFWSPHNAQFARDNGGTAIVLPSITMKTTNVHGRVGILIGWLASQTDMLAEDWQIVE